MPRGFFLGLPPEEGKLRGKLNSASQAGRAGGNSSGCNPISMFFPPKSLRFYHNNSDNNCQYGNAKSKNDPIIPEIIPLQARLQAQMAAQRDPTPSQIYLQMYVFFRHVSLVTSGQSLTQQQLVPPHPITCWKAWDSFLDTRFDDHEYSCMVYQYAPHDGPVPGHRGPLHS